MKKPSAVLPPINTLVRDTASGRVGILRATLTHKSYAYGTQREVAYLAPEEGGGLEWETDPKNVVSVEIG